MPQLVVTPAQVRPGDTVTVAGTRGFGFTNPVQIRFGAVDGPALGSFQPDTQPYAAWGPGTISIPAGTSAGAHVLYATQELSPVEKHIRGVPAQATIEVLGTGGRPVLGVPLTEAGPVGEAGLLKEEEVGTGPLVLVGLGVAGLAMFVAGAAALLSR
ncbi:MAG: hypothetical protein ACRD0M_10370, partial [Acidimicrobiales bacterium]